jgi:hypothetical protein
LVKEGHSSLLATPRRVKLSSFSFDKMKTDANAISKYYLPINHTSEAGFESKIN